jgi:large repetitive protein
MAITGSQAKSACAAQAKRMVNRVFSHYFYRATLILALMMLSPWAMAGCELQLQSPSTLSNSPGQTVVFEYRIVDDATVCSAPAVIGISGPTNDTTGGATSTPSVSTQIFPNQTASLTVTLGLINNGQVEFTIDCDACTANTNITLTAQTIGSTWALGVILPTGAATTGSINFPTNLEYRVARDGNPINGIDVSFSTLPNSAGTFGSTTVTSDISPLGGVTNTFTPTTGGPITVIASFCNPDLPGCVAVSNTVTVNVDALGFQINSGNNQQGLAGQLLSQPLEMRAFNGAVAAANEGVTWSVTSGDAALENPTTTNTDANGLASTQIRFGATPGPIIVRAESTTQPSAFVEFDLTLIAPTPVYTINFSPLATPQLINPLASPQTYVVRATVLKDGSPAGLTALERQVCFDFSLVSSFASFSGGNGSCGTNGRLVDADTITGIAEASLTVANPSTAGQQVGLRITGQNFPTDTGTGGNNTLGVLYDIGLPKTLIFTPITGDNAIQPINTTVGFPIEVRVLDNANNPIVNEGVNFTVTGGAGLIDGGSGQSTTASATTNASGYASVILTTGSTLAPIVISANLSNAPDTNNTVTILPATPSVTITNGDNQTGTPNTALAQNIEVSAILTTQLDTTKIPVGALINFNIVTGSGSFTPTTANVDAAGRASVAWTLGPIVGANQASASILNGNAVTFNATAANATTLTIADGNNQTQRSGQNFPLNPLIRAFVLGVATDGLAIEYSILPSSTSTGSTIAACCGPTGGGGFFGSAVLAGSPGSLNIRATLTSDPTVFVDFSLTVSVNQPPTTTNDNISTVQGLGISFNPVSNDTDPENDDLNIVSITQGTLGTASFSGNSILYTPNSGVTGTDTFTYTISDGVNNAVGTITMTISAAGNSPPVANDDSYTITEDIAGNFNPTSNDTDPDANPITLVSVGTTALGTTSISGNTVTYNPNSNATGTETFTYTISDGITNSSGNISVSITPVNDAPIANTDTLSTTINTTINLNPLVNDTDVESDPLSVTAATNGTSGDVTVVSSTSLQYTPSTGFTGTDSFTYTLSDGTNSVTGTVNVTVSAGVTLTSIAITPVNATIAANGTQAYTAIGTYSDSSTADITGTVVWNSSNTTAATMVANIATGANPSTAANTSISATLGVVSALTTLNVSAPVRTIAINAGNSQTVVAGNAFAPISVLVQNDGAPVVGLNVSWTVSGAGAATPTTSSTVTNSLGIATLNLNEVTAGAISVTAARSDELTIFTAFNHTINAAPPSTLAIVSGNAQRGVIGSVANNALVVRLLDGASLPIAGQAIAWSIVSGPATLSGTSSNTNASGEAQINLTFGTTTGTVVIRASALAGSQTQDFSADAVDVGIAPSSGNGQSGPVGSVLPQALTVQIIPPTGVTSAGGKLGNTKVLNGVPIQFVISTGTGASLSVSNAITNASGLASTQLTLGPTPGAYTVTATVQGGSTT